MVELVVVAGYIAITGQYTLTKLKGGALGTVDSLVSWKIIHDTLTFFFSIICFKARYRVVIILDNCYGYCVDRSNVVVYCDLTCSIDVLLYCGAFISLVRVAAI